jgi:hypothetical protein
MCSGNHALHVVVPIASPDLATRTIVYQRDIGLSNEQLLDIIGVVQTWRRRYVELVEQIVALGDEADRCLNNFVIDSEAVKALAAERRELIAALEDEFVDAWAEYQAKLSEDQFDRLIELYEAEFRNLPHPILGAKNMHAAIG